MCFSVEAFTALLAFARTVHGSSSKEENTEERESYFRVYVFLNSRAAIDTMFVCFLAATYVQSATRGRGRLNQLF